jgi:hypothetical protein
MNIHVLTSFWRIENKDILIDYLKPMDITWHPVVYVHDYKENILFNEPWIEAVYMDNYPPGVHRNYHKMNYFIETQEIVDDDYYCFMADDDMYEADVMPFVKEQTADVVFISAKRGDHRIPFGNACHGTHTLFAYGKDSIRMGNVDKGQIFVKGKILKASRFGNIDESDGLYAEWLVNNFKYIKYAPDKYFLFNFFQPGRWDKNDI